MTSRSVAAPPLPVAAPPATVPSHVVPSAWRAAVVAAVADEPLRRRHHGGVETVTIEGLHALKHALRFGADVVEARSPDPAALDALAAELCPDVRARIAALVTPGPAAHPTGVTATAHRPPADVGALLADRSAPVVLLEDPRRLGNVGAAIRVAAAAGAAGVLTTGRADPWDPAALRGAAGLHFALPVVQLGAALAPPAAAPAAPPNAAPAASPPAAPRAAAAGLPDLGGRPLIALDPDGDPLGAVPDDAVLAFGTERDGLSPALLARADARVRIPMRPGVSSLNLATAVAAVLFGRR